MAGWKSSHLQVNSFQRSEKLAAEILRMSPEEVPRLIDGWRGPLVGKGNGVRWKKVKDTCLKEVDQIEGNQEKGNSRNRLFWKISKFLKKVWLLSKRMFVWRLQIDLFSTYSRKICVIDPSLTTGYGKPPRAFQQQAAVMNVVKLHVETVSTWAMKKAWLFMVYMCIYIYICI